MKNKEAEEKLFSEFPSVSREEWEALITSDLKGADYRERLKWNTLEGISPLPFYMREDTNRVPPIFSAKSWTHCEPVFDQEPSQIRQTIELAYQRGSRAFQITSKLTSSRSDEDGSHTIQLYGSKITDQESFDLLFENTDTKKISLYFDTGTLSPLFSAMVKNHPQPFQRAVFFYDPITESIASGLKLWETDEDFQARVRQAENLAADALFYHKAGCTIVSEAAIAISILSEYLSVIPQDQRETAARSFVIRVSAGPLYFPEIAKFRALRLLWKNLLEAYGLDTSIPAEIHAETTLQNKSASDPHNNMLRVTTEAMAAATGGADSLTIYPYDASFSRPDNFSTRIAGNVHHILKEESHLNKTADPSAGSYYIENLTRDIAEKAWKEFAESESKGGFLKYIQSGDLGKKINASRSAKENAYATRKRVLTGNNHYPNTQENLSVSPEKTQPFPKSTITGAGKEGNGAEKNYAASEFQKKLNNGHTLSTLLPSVILSGD
ncbi:MAG: methylmalonyl-CoA mutase family protein, partial [Balneolaceae bacterium]|nr:methylmalonyl-CoA mutase family protein [Balneolaceae bacterium]